MFHDAFVVIDEQAPEDKVGFQFLFAPLELDCCAYRIGRATAELSLVVYRLALCAEIGFRWQFCQVDDGRGIQVIALVGHIG